VSLISRQAAVKCYPSADALPKLQPASAMPMLHHNNTMFSYSCFDVCVFFLLVHCRSTFIARVLPRDWHRPLPDFTKKKHRTAWQATISCQISLAMSMLLQPFPKNCILLPFLLQILLHPKCAKGRERLAYNPPLG